ncbi:MAG: lipid IV(A) 3-deoxy-D-manno-octulosonic acid transferase [Gammaproteobacteria bacterium]
MARILYSLLLYLLLPAVLLRVAWRARQAGAGGHGIAERLGFVAPAAGRPLLIHCVSVGETQAAVPLVEALLQRGERPWVTSTTLTGAARVRAQFGERVAHSFLPVDTPGAVSRFLDRVRPRALLVMETEIWPNLVAACRARDVPVILVNARLSEKSARGYARFAGFTRETLAGFTMIAAQADADAARFRALGAPRVEVTGNLKFDQAAGSDTLAQAAQLRAGWGGRPAWIAASTHAGEDEIVLAAHRALRARFPSLLLVLVPRHPERFDAVAALAAREGGAVARRSRGDVVAADTAVYLGDTMGELNLLYATADVAFVGGSFSGTGGHNLLEPAALALPLCSGPSLFNFQQIADALAARGALQVVADADALAGTVSAWLADNVARLAAGRRGRDFVQENRGALARTLALIERTVSR